MRWAIFAAAVLSVLLTLGAGLFAFVSHAMRDVSVACDVPQFPLKADGSLVSPGPEFAVICRERTRYWWQGDD
jgi:hypothetical protein